MAGMLNIGLSGLNAAQNQLNTTSHNISNAATPGYTRQTVNQASATPFNSGAGFIGQGVQVTNVSRQYSEFLHNQVLSADNRRAEFSAYNEQISQLNNLLADSDAGLGPAFDNFFEAVQEVAANPSDVSARQSMISNGEALATIFRSNDRRMEEVRQGAEGEIRGSVERINSLASDISELNRQIALSVASSGGKQPNDLLDQRDRVLGELNQLIDTRTNVDDDGHMNVFIGSGQNLVLGEQVTELDTVRDDDDPQRFNVVIRRADGGEVPMDESILTGGELGGLLQFRRESLDSAQDQLNRIARQVTETFNSQHRLGVDLEDEFGLDFFNASMVKRESGTGGAPEVSIVDDRLLSNGQFTLEVADAATGSFTLTNANGDSVAPADIGLQINLPDNAVDGDRFTLEPLSNAAASMDVVISNPEKLAAAGPVVVEAPLSNEGSGEAADIRMLARGDMNGGAGGFTPFALRFDAASNTLQADPPGGLTVDPTDFDPAVDSSGKTITVESDDGWAFEFELSGAPKDGDEFMFGPNVGGVADNRNAVALGALQTSKTMLNSNGGTDATATFQSAYSQMVSQIGNKTREVQSGEQTQQSLLEQAEQARESLSGVNLDEEAANLIRYQQAYQASGRVISVAQRLFDEIVSIGR